MCTGIIWVVCKATNLAPFERQWPPALPIVTLSLKIWEARSLHLFFCLVAEEIKNSVFLHCLCLCLSVTHSHFQNYDFFIDFFTFLHFGCMCVCVCVVCVCVVIYLNLLIYLEIGIAWSADKKCQLHNGWGGAHLHWLCGGVGACLQLHHSPLHLNSAPPPPPGGGCGHCNFIQVQTVDSPQTLQDSLPWYNCNVVVDWK